MGKTPVTRERGVYSPDKHPINECDAPEAFVPFSHTLKRNDIAIL